MNDEWVAYSFDPTTRQPRKTVKFQYIYPQLDRERSEFSMLPFLGRVAVAGSSVVRVFTNHLTGWFCCRECGPWRHGPWRRDRNAEPRRNEELEFYAL